MSLFPPSRCWRSRLGSFWPLSWDTPRPCCTASSARTAKHSSHPRRTPPSGCGAPPFSCSCSCLFVYFCSVFLFVRLPFIISSSTPPTLLFFFLTNSWHVLPPPPPTCFPFFFGAINYSSPPSPFLTLSKTACSARLFIPTVFQVSGVFTFLYLLHSTSFSFCLLSSSTSFFFSPSFSSSPLSIALYLPSCAHVDRVCNCLCLCVHVCISGRHAPSTPPFMLCCSSLLPLLPSHLLLLLLHLLLLPTALSTAALPPLSDGAVPRSVFMLQLPTPSLFSDRPLLIQELSECTQVDMCSAKEGGVYLDVNGSAEWM